MVERVPGITRVMDGHEVTRQTVLGICTSLKPAPGQHGPSATRSLLCYAMKSVSHIYPDISLLDLRDHPLPFFDGRTGQEYADPHLDLVSSCIERASALLLSVPGYWCGVSGVFKNFVDTLCGAAYDLPSPHRTVFTSKRVGLLVVGADDRSSAAAAAQAIAIMESTGATIVGRPSIVSNPRGRGVDTDLLSRELVSVAGELAVYACRVGR